jgi:hypothetical protein
MLRSDYFQVAQQDDLPFHVAVGSFAQFQNTRFGVHGCFNISRGPRLGKETAVKHTVLVRGIDADIRVRHAIAEIDAHQPESGACEFEFGERSVLQLCGLNVFFLQFLRKQKIENDFSGSERALVVPAMSAALTATPARIA